ncbi:uncharacterized protein LODBEIA_P07100 [Lodderomyces beijingensis]|uniref:Lysophospholipase n=1 Tax=Lodderomyces beijingensis TaxID=1775926 RepID=A0ABP0ZHA1_9ASCO
MKKSPFICVVASLSTLTQAFWPFDSGTASQSGSAASSPSATATDGGDSWYNNLFGFGNDSSPASAASTSISATGAAGTGSSNPYAPIRAACPGGSLIREADGLSDNEKDYIRARQEMTNSNIIDFLQNRANLSDFDAESFVNDNAQEHNITIGLTFSGGGYRAMLCGAGQLLATDGRFPDANAHGVGGLLQSATYLVGLSGGNWLVGSLVMNNWISVGDIVNGTSNIWQLEDSIINPSGLRIDKTIAYYYGLQQAVEAKSDAGFNTTITDIWGRALAHQFFDDPSGGENITWSSVRNMSHFQDHTMPYFFVVANGRSPHTLIINENSTVVEISAYDLGSWDRSLRSFTDVEYLGSVVNDGNPNNTDVCVRRFDNAGFIMGTSSSLFNQIVLQLGNYDINSIIKSVLTDLLLTVTYEQYDIAAYAPNPFFGNVNGESDHIAQNETLFLVDGGEDLQNVPFYPLIQTARDVDVIFAFDNSADTIDQWPNGTSIQETYKRQFSLQGKGTPFPFAPDVDTFIKQKLHEKPVFFGCNASELDDLVAWHENDQINSTDVPLVVYISNARQSYNSNFSTFKLSYEDQEKWGAIQNGFEVMSRNNLTEDSNWLACVGCAIIRRQQERFGQEQSEQCKSCFQEYCWTGGAKEAAAVSSVSGISGLATSSPTSSPSSSASGSGGSSSSSGSSSSKDNDGEYSTRLPSYLLLLANLILGFTAFL